MSPESLKSLFHFTINNLSREAVFDLAYPSSKFKCRADKMPHETGRLARRGSTVFSPNNSSAVGCSFSFCACLLAAARESRVYLSGILKILK